MTTQAVVERYLALFKEFTTNGAAVAPDWLKELRRGAMRRFAEMGFPSSREEGWRFTSVAPIAEREFVLPSDAPRLPTLADLHRFFVDGPRVVIVNGTYIPALSATAGLPPDVSFTGLARMLEERPEAVRAHLTRHARTDGHGFAALNAAFIRDGAYLHVPARTTVTAPLQILFVTVAGGDAPVVHPRSLVVIDRDADAQVIESYVALDGGTYLTNAVTELVLGDNARARHCRIQRESETAYHIAANQASQGRDSRLVSTSVALGAALCRHDLGALLQGTGAHLILDGLSVLGGVQHVDHHTTIDHAQPQCESHELFNGVFAGRSRGVFTGRIIVRPGAQRTDSKQTNNNLLLSRDARADSQPQLEIYADDVKCTHGSTVGPLDEAALFYLRSRAIGAQEAQGLLTYGFAAELLDRIEIPGVREMLDHLLRERLGVIGVPEALVA